MIKWLLRMIFRRVCVEVCTLLGQEQQAEFKKTWAKCRALIRVTRRQRSMARACIRSHIINARHGVFDFF